MKKYSYKTLMIDDLYVNPENYRYVNEVQDEIKAIIAMFEVPSGEPKKEMVNLAKDCFLQALFGQNCKIFLDIVASPFWTKLQSTG